MSREMCQKCLNLLFVHLGKLSSLQKALQKQNKVKITILKLNPCLRYVASKKFNISANGCKTLGTFFLTHNYGNYENVEALR